MSSLASALWETLNSDDTYLPFYLTLSIFSASYIFCWLYNNEKKDRCKIWVILVRGVLGKKEIDEQKKES